MNFLDKRFRKTWLLRTDQVGQYDAATLRSMRNRAKGLLTTLSGFSRAAHERIGEELSKTIAISAPYGSDWKHRPALWVQKYPRAGSAPVKNEDWFGHEIQIFHDCSLNEIILRQQPKKSPQQVAPYEISLEVFDFKGSYLSIVYNFPAGVVENLSRKHILRVVIEAGSDQPVSAYVQLNIKHGPNIEQMVVVFDLANPKPIDFDLADTDINEKRIESVWVALILNNPGMSAISATDFICSRRLRAEF